MLSSRKVYAPSAAPLAETAPTGPSDAYGRNKLAVEDALRDLLGERLTVLRLANIFGYERSPAATTFVSISLDRLAREGRIHYAMSPFVERDFSAGRDRVRARAGPEPPWRRPAAFSTSAPASACRPVAWRFGSWRASAAASW